jgi:glycosidase
MRFPILIFPLLAGSLLDALPAPPILEPYEHPAQDNVYYFVLTDRFDDGKPTNNTIGGGYDPTNPAAYHGGDFIGLQNRLDYLKGLGVNALWLTPIFKNQAVQGGTSAYHGYWITDFLNVDPHLGTNAEFRSLVEAAHGRDIRIFLDIITNHTADVNQYFGPGDAYVSKADAPYKDAQGVPFDDRDYAWNGLGEPFFPELDEATSFPLRPFIPREKENLRNPAWLNDVRNYHNRGASSFSGENSLYGDFFGLDDIFTEKPEVVQGMIDIYSYWIREYKVDGFRIDTVKHVNQEFWQAFGPAIQAAATESGTGHFFQFAEVFNFDPVFLSEFSTVVPLDSTLDFAMAGEARAFAYQGVSSANLNFLFTRDDLLTDADSHANARPLFIGNHDIGRAGTYVRADNPGAPEAELIDRLELAKAVLFFTRGQPVIYYGDEQGFAGAGGPDYSFREDMMSTQTPLYRQMDLIGTNSTPADDNFDASHPLYESFAEVAALYHAHPPLRRGAHIPRTSGSNRVVAVSRIHRSDLVEYLFVACNQESGQVSTNIPTSQAGGTTFTRIGSSRESAAPASLTTNAAGRVAFDIEGLQWVLYKAESSLPASQVIPQVSLTSVTPGSVQTVQGYSQEGHDFPGRLEIAASTNVKDYAEVTFAYLRSDQPGTWHSLGVDTAPPYRVYFRPPAQIPPGVTFTFAASVNNGRGLTAQTTAPDVLLTRGAPVTSLIIHYNRDAASATGWGVVAEGTGITGGKFGTPGNPEPFIGEDAFGSFAIIPLTDPAKPLRFVIQKANGNSYPNDRSWDGMHTVIPQSTAEVWVAQDDVRLYSSLGEWKGYVDVRYRRTIGGSAGWKLEVANAFTGSIIDTVDPVSAAGITAVFRLNPSLLGVTWGSELSLRPVHDQNGYEGDGRILPLRTAGEVWLKQGIDQVLLTSAAVQNIARIHYRRPAGDYGDSTSSDYRDFWGLHVWSGAANPTQWSSPIRPSHQDSFGLIFEVPLQAGATSLSYILHKGDTKDPGPDQSLPLESAGHEVWQIQGADNMKPYIRTTGLRGLYGGFLQPQEAVDRSGLRITPSMKIELYSPAGHRFTLQEAQDLTQGIWTTIGGPFLGTGEIMEFSMPETTGKSRWFRLVTQ